MAISGQIDINIGAPNDPIGSDSLYTAFNAIQDNFDNLFDNTPGNGNITSIVTSSNSLTSTSTLVGDTATITFDLGRAPLGNGNLYTPANLANTTFVNPNIKINQFGLIQSISNGTVTGISNVILLSGNGIGLSANTISPTIANWTITNEGVTGLIAGAGITLSGNTGNVTITANTTTATGTVTSVGLEQTGNNFVIAGTNPVTNSGNFRLDLSNTIYIANDINAGNAIYSNGLVSASILAGVLIANSANQPNITQVGTLVNLAVTGNIVGSNYLTIANNITANNVTANANINAPTFNANAVNSNYFAALNQMTSPVFIGSFTGNGANITSMNATSLTSGLVPSARMSGLYSGITGLGTLGSLAVSGLTQLSTLTANAATFSNTAIFSNSMTSINANGNVVAKNFIGNVVGNISGTFVAPGANTEVLFNNDGNVAASANLTYDYTTGNVSIGSNLSITDTLDVLNITGVETITAGGGGLTITGLTELVMSGGLTVANATTPLTIDGDGYLNSTQTEGVLANGAGGAIQTLGGINAANGLYVSGNSYFVSNVILSGNTAAQLGNLSTGTFILSNISGASIGGNLNIGQEVTAIGNMTVGNTASTDGYVYIQGIKAANTNVLANTDPNYYASFSTQGGAYVALNINVGNINGQGSDGSLSNVMIGNGMVQCSTNNSGTITTVSIGNGSANLGNSVTANFFIGSAANLANVPVANLVGNLSNATGINATVAANTTATVTQLVTVVINGTTYKLMATT